VLARHVLAAYGRVLAHGAAIATTFLIPTPHLVQKGLTSLPREGIKPVPVKKQGRSSIDSSLTFTGDLVFGTNET